MSMFTTFGMRAIFFFFRQQAPVRGEICLPNYLLIIILFLLLLLF